MRRHVADRVSNRRPLRGIFKPCARFHSASAADRRPQPQFAVNNCAAAFSFASAARSIFICASNWRAAEIIATILPSLSLTLTVTPAPMLTTELSGTFRGLPSPSTGSPLRMVEGGRSRAGLPGRCEQRAGRKCVPARAGRCVRNALNSLPLVGPPMSATEGCRPENRLTGYDPLATFKRSMSAPRS